MVYLDANVFVFSQISKEKEGREAAVVLNKMEEGKFTAITSVLTIDEVVWKIKKEVDYSSAIRVGKEMFTLENLEIADATQEIVKNSLRFMEKYGLEPRDAIHVATMMEKNIKEIVTEDPDFKKINEIKVYSIIEFIKKLK